MEEARGIGFLPGPSELAAGLCPYVVHGDEDAAFLHMLSELLLNDLHERRCNLFGKSRRFQRSCLLKNPERVEFCKFIKLPTGKWNNLMP